VGGGELEYAVEDESAAARATAVEAEHELAQVAQLQRVLGHADIKTTSIYLTVRAHQVDDVVERMAIPDTTLDADHATEE